MHTVDDVVATSVAIVIDSSSGLSYSSTVKSVSDQSGYITDEHEVLAYKISGGMDIIGRKSTGNEWSNSTYSRGGWHWRINNSSSLSLDSDGKTTYDGLQLLMVVACGVIADAALVVTSLRLSLQRLAQPRIPVVDVLHCQITPVVYLTMLKQTVIHQPIMLAGAVLQVQLRYLALHPIKERVVLMLRHRARIDISLDGFHVDRLPMFYELSDEDVKIVIEMILNFYK